jgi:hypothetical protein
MYNLPYVYYISISNNITVYTYKSFNIPGFNTLSPLSATDQLMKNIQLAAMVGHAPKLWCLSPPVLSTDQYVNT